MKCQRLIFPCSLLLQLGTSAIFSAQFHGYNEANPVEEHIEKLVRDVLDRWAAEKSGQEDVGRTLPQEYLYFWGDGRHNHFTIEYHGQEEWDWSMPNPYEN
ncbi:MAG: hypothetical protein HFE45_11815 [Oscillospiraceae bacterium]|nr:hypothetical protein [Oscillospiraceae bacterium]